MTDLEKRATIAETCGFTWWQSGGGSALRLFLEPPANKLFRKVERPKVLEPVHFLHVDDFLNSLDAMALAMTHLTYEQTERFCDELNDIVEEANSERENVGTHDFELINATAPQRAEAFLRTIGAE